MDQVGQRPSARGPEAEPAPIAPRLGEILIRHGLVSPEAVDRALAEQAAGAEWRLGRILVYHGMISDADLSRAIADQFHVGVVDLRRWPPRPETIARLGREAAFQLQALPVDVDGDVVVVAVSDPPTRELRVALERSVGGPVRLVLSPADELTDALAYWYREPPRDDGEPIGTDPRRSPVDATWGPPATPAAFPGPLPPTAPVAPPRTRLDDQVVDWLLAEASRRGATAIHLDHDGTGLQVRYRGAAPGLTPGPLLPPTVGTVVCHRVLAAVVPGSDGDDGSVHEGRFDTEVAGRPVTCQVVAVGSAQGTHVVVRIGPRDRRSPRLEGVGLSPGDAAALGAVLDRGAGVVVVTGGSDVSRSLVARAVTEEAGPAEFAVAMVGLRHGLGIPFAAVFDDGDTMDRRSAIAAATRLGVDVLLAEVGDDRGALLAAFDAASDRLVVLVRPEGAAAAVTGALVEIVGALLVVGSVRAVVVCEEDGASVHLLTDDMCRLLLDPRD